MKVNAQTVKGMVVESRPGDLYLVELEGGKQVLAKTSGKMRFNHIHVIVGDRVEVALDPYGGKTTNRIERRL